MIGRPEMFPEMMLREYPKMYFNLAAPRSYIGPNIRWHAGYAPPDRTTVEELAAELKDEDAWVSVLDEDESSENTAGNVLFTAMDSVGMFDKNYETAMYAMERSTTVAMLNTRPPPCKLHEMKVPGGTMFVSTPLERQLPRAGRVGSAPPLIGFFLYNVEVSLGNTAAEVLADTRERGLCLPMAVMVFAAKGGYSLFYAWDHMGVPVSGIAYTHLPRNVLLALTRTRYLVAEARTPKRPKSTKKRKRAARRGIVYTPYTSLTVDTDTLQTVRRQHTAGTGEGGTTRAHMTRGFWNHVWVRKPLETDVPDLEKPGVHGPLYRVTRWIVPHMRGSGEYVPKVTKLKKYNTGAT